VRHERRRRLWKDAGISTLNGELWACIADGRVAIDDPVLLDHLMLRACDRIAVDSPNILH
jgi:hypothetical protein